MIILAAVAGLAILCLTALCLKTLADGQERMRLLAPQIRVVSPPKAEAPKDDEELLARLAAAKREEPGVNGVADIGHEVIGLRQEGGAS